MRQALLLWGIGILGKRGRPLLLLRPSTLLVRLSIIASITGNFENDETKGLEDISIFVASESIYTTG